LSGSGPNPGRQSAVTNFEMARSVLSGIRPALVINTAAYHRVDECETRADLAFDVNAIGVRNLSIVCRELGSTLMHFSTDYVFSGTASSPYKEQDPAEPVSAYGISKAAGEHFIRYLLPGQHMLVRSSGLYGVAGASGKGGNFVETMLRMAREGRPIRVVNDQRSCPTYTFHLASALFEVIERQGRGTFHITNSGECTWYEFAAEIFKIVGLEPDFGPTTSEEFGAAAKRPAYSVLDNARIRALGVSPLPAWQQALRHYLQAKGHIHS
jgi:dTDP-4-dehydrorhamnose reductase